MISVIKYRHDVQNSSPIAVNQSSTACTAFLVNHFMLPKFVVIYIRSMHLMELNFDLKNCSVKMTKLSRVSCT